MFRMKNVGSVQHFLAVSFHLVSSGRNWLLGSEALPNILGSSRGLQEKGITFSMRVTINYTITGANVNRARWIWLLTHWWTWKDYAWEEIWTVPSLWSGADCRGYFRPLQKVKVLFINKWNLGAGTVANQASTCSASTHFGHCFRDSISHPALC